MSFSSPMAWGLGMRRNNNDGTSSNAKVVRRVRPKGKRAILGSTFIRSANQQLAAGAP
jgi:hypothetical protein